MSDYMKNPARFLLRQLLAVWQSGSTATWRKSTKLVPPSLFSANFLRVWPGRGESKVITELVSTKAARGNLLQSWTSFCVSLESLAARFMAELFPEMTMPMATARAAARLLLTANTKTYYRHEFLLLSERQRLGKEDKESQNPQGMQH